MTTAVKRKTKNHIKTIKRQAAKLPHGVAKQLEKIYVQSRKKVAKHPYQTAGGILLSLGVASGAYLLMRFLRN